MDPAESRIIEHWKANFPRRTQRLEQQGLLLGAAQEAANRAAAVLEQCAEKGLPYHQAAELAVQEWGTPPA